MVSRMERTRLVSGRAAAEILVEAGRCEGVQARDVLACGAAGLGYDFGSAVIYDHDAVAELAGRPTLTVEGLWNVLPGDVVVIARQHARTRAGTDIDPDRPWHGADVLAPDGEQRIAASRWWEIGPQRRDLIDQAVKETGSVPLLVSVGGYIARAYEIAGIDHALSQRYANGRWAFALADERPDWAKDVERRWMRSPRGTALLILARHTSG